MIDVLFHKVAIFYEKVWDKDPIFQAARKAGLELPEDHDDMQRRNIGITKGSVAYLGETAFEDCKTKPKIGDRVGFAKHAAVIVTDEITEEKFLLLNDEDIHYIQR